MAVIAFNRSAKVVVTIQYDDRAEIVFDFRAEDAPLRISLTNEFEDKEFESGRYPDIEPTGFVTLEIYGKPRREPEVKSPTGNRQLEASDCS